MWHPKSVLPEFNETVLTAVNDNGVPQCLSFCMIVWDEDEKKNKWIDLVDEDLSEPIFDYWMYIPDFNNFDLN